MLDKGLSMGFGSLWRLSVACVTLLLCSCGGEIEPLPLGLKGSLERLQGFGVTRPLVTGIGSVDAASGHPEWFPSADLFGGKSALRMYARVAQDAALFRRLDRQLSFDAVWVSGDPGNSGPLLENLVSESGWVAAYVDHQGIIFRRGEAGSVGLEVGPRDVGGLRPKELARVKSAIAVQLVALRRFTEARNVIAEARRVSSREPDVWVAEARVELGENRWEAAEAAAEKALGLRGRYLPAMSVRARALYSMGRFADAFIWSRRLVERAAGDPLVLFNHAKIAHELRIFGDEVETLRRLIEVVERDGGWSAGYRIYLGQAYAALGEGESALSEFRSVRGDPGLSVDQQSFVKEALEKLEGR